MSTVTTIVKVGVAILVTVRTLDPLGVSKNVNSHRDRGGWGCDPRNCLDLRILLEFLKMLTVTGIVGAGVAILVTVIVFGPSDPLEVSKM